MCVCARVCVWVLHYFSGVAICSNKIVRKSRTLDPRERKALGGSRFPLYPPPPYPDVLFHGRTCDNQLLCSVHFFEEKVHTCQSQSPHTAELVTGEAGTLTPYLVSCTSSQPSSCWGRLHTWSQPEGISVTVAPNIYGIAFDNTANLT